MSSSTAAIREFTSRFRFQDNSFSSFSTTQRSQIKKFQEFAAKTPKGFCSICLEVFYPGQQHFRLISNAENLNCHAWKLQPMTIDGKVMVCKRHYKEKESDFPVYEYPEFKGDIVKETESLNQCEHSFISPVKLVSQITRKSSSSGRIGHYKLSGSFWVIHNYEFTTMAYSGTLELYY
ncbi:hypothetical protein BD560DRAFT_451079 [Blakeslea trispora]|nr:hypothetical protein BD560DRAFT_451079 [Blakeslea trispora]